MSKPTTHTAQSYAEKYKGTRDNLSYLKRLRRMQRRELRAPRA